MSSTWIDDPAVTKLELGNNQPLHHGKVREIYDLGENLLLVATDRISAFDCILPDGIPGKGKVLTSLSVAWFDAMDGVIDHHYISKNPDDFPEAFKPYRDVLADRSLLVRKAKRYDVECVVRGYITGSGWKDYQRSGKVCGIPLPPDLQESQKLPEPIFTPSTKADTGHDENIDFNEMTNIVGGDIAGQLRDLSLKIYTSFAAYCATRGIIVADTKFEFGEIDGKVAVIDEVFTPDSSRFWPADEYAPGRSQDSFDKQYVRDYLETLDWNKTPPAPRLPKEIIRATARRYDEALHKLYDPNNPFKFTKESIS